MLDRCVAIRFTTRPLIEDDAEVPRDALGVVGDVDEHLVRLAVLDDRDVERDALSKEPVLDVADPLELLCCL